MQHYSPTGSWATRIKIDGKTTSIGDFSTEQEAVTAYDMALVERLGGSAFTNQRIYQEDAEQPQSLAPMCKTKFKGVMCIHCLYDLDFIYRYESLCAVSATSLSCF